MKKDMLALAREELLKLDQTVRDCSDHLMTLSPLDLETAQLRAAIMDANTKIRFVLDR